MASDGLQVVLEVHFVQSVNEQHWVGVQSSDSHLQTHGPQLTRFHPPHQTLNYCLHKQRDALWEVNSHQLTFQLLELSQIFQRDPGQGSGIKHI